MASQLRDLDEERRTEILQEFINNANLQPIRFTKFSSNDETPSYNFSKASWNHMKTRIAELLPEIIDPTKAPRQEVDKFAVDMVHAIHRAIEETTPRKRPSLFSKDGGIRRCLDYVERPITFEISTDQNETSVIRMNGKECNKTMRARYLKHNILLGRISLRVQMREQFSKLRNTYMNSMPT